MTEHIINVERVEQEIALFGSLDENIKAIEKHFGVTIVNREGNIKISGEDEEMAFKAKRAIEELLKLITKGEELTPQMVNYVLALVASSEENKLKDMGKGVVCVTARGKVIKAKTVGQQRYLDEISRKTIVLGIGPAGTGKTYLAVAQAVAAFRDKKVNTIILTRPAVEAGEKLGFLPGDLQNKVDPYLRPLYDALFDMMGAESYQNYFEKGNIEVAPLAYMRGRTLDDSFIILDEAQNTTPEQMKMFLTRMGFNSKVVITGDITQTDLPDGKTSGLRVAMNVLKDIDDIGIIQLTAADVVRHELVQKIIMAYEKYEKNAAERAKEKKKYYKKDIKKDVKNG